LGLPDGTGAGSGWPLDELGRHGLERLACRAGVASQPLERGPLVEPFARHQDPLGLLDHHAVVQRPLELRGQLGLERGALLQPGVLALHLAAPPPHRGDRRGEQPCGQEGDAVEGAVG
jgi:hypothetical protein